MRIFRVIKKVLDETYGQVRGNSDEEKNALIARRINELSGNYLSLTRPERQPIDYSKLSVRFAYIYEYLFARADFFYQILGRHPKVLGRLVNKESLQITCVGAGPGSEIIGLAKQLTEYVRTAPLRCFLCDREPAWELSWKRLVNAMNPSFNIDAEYLTIDATDKKTYAEKTSCFESDVFVFSYFFSEIFTFKPKAIDFLNHLAQNAKKGALFIFVDNNGVSFTDFADTFANSHELDPIGGDDGRFTPSHDEQVAELGQHFKRYDGLWPQLTGDVAYRLWVKR